jgi:uncharacterized protein (DUF433 family)
MPAGIENRDTRSDPLLWKERAGVWHMASNLDWSQCSAVESIPGKRSGAWVFRDSRTLVSVVFDNLEVGASIDEIMEWFHLTREQVVAVIEFAARSLDAPPAIPPAPSGVDAHPLR